MATHPKRYVHLLVLAITIIITACSGQESTDNLQTVEIDVSARSGGTPSIQVIEPADGATVTSPFRIRVSTENIDLAAAGRTLDGEAHWHVIVDRDCLPAGEVIPDNVVHRHVGSGADEAEFDLPAGVHELCVQLGDGFHVAVAITDTVEITVDGNS